MGIRLKRNLFKSFRLKLVIYAAISLGLTWLSDIGITAVLRRFVIDPKYESRIMLWLALISTLIFLLYFIILTAPTVSYIRKLLYSVTRIQNGDLDTEIILRPGDELGDLGLAIDTMRLELKATRIKESEAESLNRDLITNVAHDLRTPLTSVIGYLDILKTKDDLDEDTRNKYIGIAYAKASRMEGLVNDLFDFTRYRTNQVLLSRTRLDLKQLMTQVIDEFYPSLLEQHLDCYTVFASAPVLIDGDGELSAI